MGSRLSQPTHSEAIPSFIGAGDPSGDLLAASLLEKALPHLPALHLWGYGGNHLEDLGVRLVDHLGRFGTSGVIEAAGRLPRNAALLGRVLELVDRRPPRLSMLVDYPELHFIVGPAMHGAGARVIYLLPPQVWAWRRGRLRLMRRFVHAVAACFPFEVDLYRSEGIDAQFVGHPLCLLDPYRDPPPPGPLPDPPVVAFLPGSRPHEVDRVLPAMAGAAAILRSRIPGLICRLAPGPTVDRALVDRVLGGRGRGLFDFIRTPTREASVTPAGAALDGANAAVVHAGTATLEAALLGVPSVVVARLSRTSWEIARRFVDVPHVSMPSIVLGRAVFTERLQDEVEPHGIARDVERLLLDAGERDRMGATSQELHSMLHRPDAGERLAQLALGRARM